MRIEREEILAAYDRGPKAVVRLVEKIIRQFEKRIAKLTAELEDTIELLGIDMGAQEKKISDQELKIRELAEENRRLGERIAELEARLKLNSRNSSKPPSSDGL